MNNLDEKNNKIGNSTSNKQLKFSKDNRPSIKYSPQESKNSNTNINNINEEENELQSEFEKDKNNSQESIKKKMENENNNKNQNTSETEIIDLNSSQDNKNDQKKSKDTINNIINDKKEISNNNKNEKMLHFYSSKGVINSKQGNETNTNNNISDEFYKNDNLIDNNNTNTNNEDNSISKKSSKSTNSKEKVKDIGKEKAQQGFEDLNIEKDKDIKFIDNLGYGFDIFICGLRVQMGPFISQRKAKCVMRYIKLNKPIITSMSKEIRKDWLKNLSIMIEDLID